MAENLQNINPADLRLAAMDLLARREHLRSELAQKLKKRFSGKRAGTGTARDNVSRAPLNPSATSPVETRMSAAATMSEPRAPGNEAPAQWDASPGDEDGRQDLGEQIERVLDQLVEDNLICDQRFTESYVRQRSARGYGPDRIRQELQQKGVARDLIQDTLREIETDWVALARDVREKKFGVGLPNDFKERSRQLRFLGYRGFSGEFAASALEVDPDLD